MLRKIQYDLLGFTTSSNEQIRKAKFCRLNSIRKRLQKSGVDARYSKGAVHVYYGESSEVPTDISIRYEKNHKSEFGCLCSTLLIRAGEMLFDSHINQNIDDGLAYIVEHYGRKPVSAQ